MPAFVEHSFPGGFLIDETRLRKLKDIIESREAKNSDQKIIYQVYRGDSYYYTTESVDDVIKEDNEDWRRITRLELKLPHTAPGKEDSDLHFVLSFSDTMGCQLWASADDRDRVFLLFSDLRDYIQHEVTIIRTIDPNTSRFLGVIFSLVILALVTFTLLYRLDHPDPSGLRQALESSDIATKLNFLINQRQRSAPFGSRGLFLLVLATIASFGAMLGGLRPLFRYIFPGNLFLFGKRREHFEKRQRLTNNLLWVVGVGLMVSVAAGLIVWRFTAK